MKDPYALLLEHIGRNINLGPAEEELVTGLFRERSLKPKQFLFQEGEILKSQVFVTSGCLRSYAIDHNGFEHILQFAPEGWWIADMQSLLDQVPGKLNIDAIQASTLLQIGMSDMERLYREIPQLERHFRLLLERSVVTYQNRLLDNLSLSARERYEHFCRAYPTLIRELPQKQVASYIGVTPEFLSRMLRQPASRKG
ncbi:Crp/Fnr family transcriptional regulator [Taibaiella koreensis]|uniref:Crp/Fnr family transcriptional regulator n=1 Tax=Taibaiella koreensis TaxID=1268548 RepID=UPI000E59EC7A|nr:Crp/Fnr family transcriptional regulator [Taibaiella koreensis]